MSSKKSPLLPAFLPLGCHSEDGRIYCHFFSLKMSVEIIILQQEMACLSAFDKLVLNADEKYWKKFGINPQYKALSKAKQPKEYEPIYKFLIMASDECASRGMDRSFRIIKQGAHISKGTYYFNLGEQLLDEALNPVDFGEYGDYIFVKSWGINSMVGSHFSEMEVLDMQRFFSLRKWENPMSPIILMGFIYFSILSGIAEWRPHVSIRGEADSGKSTIARAIVKLLGENKGASIQGGRGTTEPGIRRFNEGHAWMIVYEEAEEEMKSDSKDKIMALARLTSDGLTSRQGGGGGGTGTSEFYLPCCFLLLSIGDPIKEHADLTRFISLEIKSNADNPLPWGELDRLKAKYFNEEVGRRLYHDAYSHARIFSELTTTIAGLINETERSVLNIIPILAAYCCFIKRHRDMDFIKDLITEITPTLKSMKKQNRYSERERFTYGFLNQHLELEIRGYRYRKTLHKWLRMIIEDAYEHEDEAFIKLGPDPLRKLVKSKLNEYGLHVVKEKTEAPILNIASNSHVLLSPFKNSTLFPKLKTILSSLNAQNCLLNLGGEARGQGWKLSYSKLLELPDILEEDLKQFEEDDKE
jgi:hypothetical protein